MWAGDGGSRPGPWHSNTGGSNAQGRYRTTSPTARYLIRGGPFPLFTDPRTAGEVRIASDRPRKKREPQSGSRVGTTPPPGCDRGPRMVELRGRVVDRGDRRLVGARGPDRQGPWIGAGRDLARPARAQASAGARCGVA